MLEHTLERVAENNQVDDRQQDAGEDGQRIASDLEQVAAHYRPGFSHRGSPSAPRRHRHPEARAEEAALARRLVAQTPSSESDEDVLERHPFELDRRDSGAGIFDR